MCGRAEVAFILETIGLKLEIIDDIIISVLVFSTFILNILTFLGLKGCAVLLRKKFQPGDSIFKKEFL